MKLVIHSVSSWGSREHTNVGAGGPQRLCVVFAVDRRRRLGLVSVALTPYSPCVMGRPGSERVREARRTRWRSA